MDKNDFHEDCINWANIDPELCHHMMPVGHNELSWIWDEFDLSLPPTVFPTPGHKDYIDCYTVSWHSTGS